MSDPLGLISSSTAAARPIAGGVRPQAGGASFKDVLLKNIEEVNTLQQDATKAIEDLTAGRRGDVEGVILATSKADTAFKALQAVRNKVMEAYDEIKQIRV
ncbi:MAG: flagellar hook-basal body complex protein FliE [Phycisphaeraceae bacterium]|nr:MAG: flagellar hook-basal body complex protein FliE [Phycisphaeraceae bacterium]